MNSVAHRPLAVVSSCKGLHEMQGFAWWVVVWSAPLDCQISGWVCARHNTFKRYASLSAIHFPVVGLSCHFTLYNHSNQHKTDTTAIKGMNFDSKLNPNPQQELDNKLLLHCFLSITIDTVMVWTPYILCTFLI